MDTTETRNKVDELKAHPELANTPGCEIEELREAVDPHLLVSPPDGTAAVCKSLRLVEINSGRS